jgi:hypothetical protein
VVGFCFVFCSIGCLPSEGFQMLFVAYVLGWPFRLAASRVRAARCREPALCGAGPGLSFVAYGRCFLARSCGASAFFLCVEFL